MHYGAGKIARGELFEAVDFLAFLRAQVLGPLALMEAGAAPAGVRRLETRAPARARAIQATIAPYDAAACLSSLTAAIDIYRSLRDGLGSGRVTPIAAPERIAVDYVRDVAAACGVSIGLPAARSRDRTT